MRKLKHVCGMSFLFNTEELTNFFQIKKLNITDNIYSTLKSTVTLYFT